MGHLHLRENNFKKKNIPETVPEHAIQVIGC